MKTLIAIAAVLFTIAPASAQAQKTPNLTGTWTGTLTRTAPDGRTQSIDWIFDLTTQKGKLPTGTVGPNADGSGRSRRVARSTPARCTLKVQ